MPTATAEPVVESPYMTVADAAALMGLSGAMVYQLVDDGTIPAYKHAPKCIRIHRDDVTAYLKSIRTGKPAEAEPSTRAPKLQALQPRRREGKKRKTAEAAAH